MLLPSMIASHAHANESPPALIAGNEHVSFAALNDRIARATSVLVRQGVREGDTVAIRAPLSVDAIIAFCATVAAGAIAAPLPAGLADDALQAMLADCAPRLVLADEALPLTAFHEMAAVARAGPMRSVAPGAPLNLLYSSGTTGTPKGILHSHAARAAMVRSQARYGLGRDAVTLISTPLYSNTTLIALLPTLAGGGTVVLQPKFETGAWLELAERHAVSHAMLVPVQYQRLLADPGFDAADLSAFRTKFCTSAPFPAALKAEILRRWPGGLIESYGTTEGGARCVLEAHRHPEKLTTVGCPASGHDVRLVGADDREVATGEAGEVVGHSATMMLGYRNRPDETAALIWHAPDGRPFFRTGDIGRFDVDGFLTIVDRKKDMIISGGFNIYSSDLEAVLCDHCDVSEAAVVAAPSARWGETPVAFVVAPDIDSETLRDWANARLGPIQRIAAVRSVAILPRNALGKVDKRRLRMLAAEFD
jgi:acyl-CoA synthetase (AMP-forming)/AMP-acid ligase II